MDTHNIAKKLYTVFTMSYNQMKTYSDCTLCYYYAE